MYHLYYTTNSAAMGSHAALEEIGAPFELHFVDLTKPRPAEYLRLNPHGKVPTLIDDDAPQGKRVIYQSAAILLYLADKHPEAGLAPPVGTPERGLCYQWLFFMAEALQPSYMMHFYSERFSTDPAHVEGIDAKATEWLADIWGRLEKALDPGPYLLGGNFSVCDLYMHTMAQWNQPHHRPLGDFPNVSRALALVSERPAVSRMLEVNGLA